MKKILSVLLNTFFRLFKVQKKKIVFQSARGLVDGNPKAFYDYMRKHHKDEYTLYYLVEKDMDTSFLDQEDIIYYRSMKGYYHLATAKFWVCSHSIGSLIKKRDNQIYLQTWHGRALKKMGYDVMGAEVRECMDHAKEWDYYIANDKEDVNIIRSATGFNKNAEVLGMCRTDEIYKYASDETFKKALKEKLNIKNDKKNILYCPTFREEDLENNHVEIPISKLKELEDYNVLIRVHPQIRNKISEDVFTSNFINVCQYPDIQDLLSITDILVTDYSSIFFEYAILNKPMILYCYDLEKYTKERNGFYMDITSLPCLLVKEEEALYESILNIESLYETKQKELEHFNNVYNFYNNGEVCKRFYDFITTLN